MTELRCMPIQNMYDIEIQLSNDMYVLLLKLIVPSDALYEKNRQKMSFGSV
jgi:hypothetical protein